MSKLEGHKEITRRAVSELMLRGEKHPVMANLHHMALRYNVQMRDIFDVVQLGHWTNGGQRHHFMRSFDGQSHHMAYLDAILWIQKNALEAANTLKKRIAKFEVKDAVDSGNAADRGRKAVRGEHVGINARSQRKDIVNWFPLAYACHALQDSFSASHVVRKKHVSASIPGEITSILKYAGVEKEGHSGKDKEWEHPGQEGAVAFTLSGKVAINATKDLISLVVQTAFNHTSTDSIKFLDGWDRFISTWLYAPKLSIKRDLAVDLIHQFSTNIEMGNMNFLTLSMDEEGLANAILKEHPSNMVVVHDIFFRLDNHFSSNADDVAKIYLSNMKKKSGSVEENSLRKNKTLVALLTKILNQGWATSEEKQLVAYLK
jgi:hypothetical protein